MRGIPSSRAYWELKAEQVLNRVFDAETAIEVEVLERPPEPPVSTPEIRSPAPGPGTAAADQATAKPKPAARKPKPRQPRPSRPWPAWMGNQPGLVLAGIGVTGLIAAGGSLVLIGLWSQSQQTLRQERSLLLLERLRSLGPAAAAPAAMASADTAEAKTGAATDGLPPPPPSEPWMQELASLPSSGTPTAEPIRVPVNGRITSPPAPASPATGSSGSSWRPSGAPSGGAAPQLVGVVQVPGRSGSAIFQVGGSSTSAGVGESIGGSGWRLVSASGDTALIERGGEQRRLSISSGF